MDVQFLKYTDSELVVLASLKPSKREAKREIQRRKRVGAWRLLANWKREAAQEVDQEEAEERVYAPGVRRNGS